MLYLHFSHSFCLLSKSLFPLFSSLLATSFSSSHFLAPLFLTLLLHHIPSSPFPRFSFFSYSSSSDVFYLNLLTILLGLFLFYRLLILLLSFTLFSFIFSSQLLFTHSYNLIPSLFFLIFSSPALLLLFRPFYIFLLLAIKVFQTHSKHHAICIAKSDVNLCYTFYHIYLKISF